MVKTIKTEKARQGRRGVHALVILLVSVILAAIGIWVAAVYSRRSAHKEPAYTTQPGSTDSGIRVKGSTPAAPARAARPGG